MPLITTVVLPTVGPEVGYTDLDHYCKDIINLCNVGAMHVSTIVSSKTKAIYKCYSTSQIQAKPPMYHSFKHKEKNTL